MWRTIGVAFQRNGGYGNHRRLCKPLFQIVVFRLTFGEAEPPAVVVNDNRDMVRIVECRSTTIKRCVIKFPLWRSKLPDQPVEIVTVFVVAVTSAIGGEVILVPPLEFGCGWQRVLAGCLAANQISTDRNQAFAAFRPKSSDNVSGPCAPIEASNDCLIDLQGVHEMDDVDSHHSWLSVADRVIGKKPSTAIAAQVGYEDVVSRRSQYRNDIDKAVNVVRPAVQENYGCPIRWSGFSVAHIQQSGIDLLDGAE